MQTKYLIVIALLFFGITKFCHAQQYVWAKSLAGRGISTLTNLMPGSSNAEAFAVDSIGNVYITGYSNDTVDFDPGPNEVLLDAGNDDIYIAKYDAMGNYLWAHVFWSPGHNYGTNIKLDNDGNVVIVGHAQSLADFDPSTNLHYLGNNATANYAFIAKYDANGNFIWANEIGNNFGTFINDLSIDYNNNIVITGYFYGSIDMDPDTGAAYINSNQTGIFTAKYNQSGQYIWAKCISGIGNLGESQSVVCGKNGNIYVAGIFGNKVDFDPGPDSLFYTAQTTCDRFFLKYNTMGDLIWAKEINVNEDGMLFADRAIKIALDDDENVYLTGNFLGTVDFNPATAVFNIVAPPTTSSYICKFTTNGHFLWAKGIIGGVVQTTGIALDCNNNICLTGSFASADFDPSTGLYPFQSSAPSAFNNFIAKYSNTGDFIWVKQLGNNGYGGSTLSASLALKLGYVYVAGGFKQTANFNQDGSATLQSSGVDQNSFFAKYTYFNYENILTDTALCAGQTLKLDVAAHLGSYLWSNQSTNAAIDITQAGNYWVNITSENCITIDSVTVTYNSVEGLKQSDTTICEGEKLILNAGNNNAQFLWQDNSTAGSFEVSQAGTYWVNITQNNCTLIDTIEVNTVPCEALLAYPNVFTPNADGHNETFVPIKYKGIQQAQLAIYNRWGQKIFESDNVMEGWDGKINQHTLASAGVYYWHISYTTFNQQQLSKKGFVTVLK